MGKSLALIFFKMNINKILEIAKELPARNKNVCVLDPYIEVIRELRRKHYTHANIKSFLMEYANKSVSVPTIQKFVKRNKI